MQRKALLIASSEYEDTNITDLSSPETDVTELAKLLENNDIGGFDVEKAINEPSHMIRPKIEKLFIESKRDDVILLYFSGHGIYDDNDRLYLATSDTDNILFQAKSIEASFIRNQMGAISTNSKRQIIILDCCYAAKFMSATKALPMSISVGEIFDQGSGQYIFTATNRVQKAFEGNVIIGEEIKNSIFTYYIIEGIKTGEADINNDGWVDANELFTYVFDKVTSDTEKQLPQKYVLAQEGEDIRIARSNKRTEILLETIEASQVATSSEVFEASHPSFCKSNGPKQLAELLNTIGRLVTDAKKEAICHRIGVDPYRLDLGTNSYDFSTNLIKHLCNNGDREALIAICDDLLKIAKNDKKAQLEYLRSQLTS